MSSSIHSKVLSRLPLLVSSVVLMCFSLTVRAELEVEWIDKNTIRVWGTGDGGSQTVVTNWLGCCTNCTLITPEELTAGMDSIISKCSDIVDISSNIDLYVSSCLADLDYKLDDISTFRRFGSTIGAGDFSITNYVKTVDNTQTRLDLQMKPSTLNQQTVRTWTSYNNGIYDYANDSVKPFLNISVRSNYNFIKNLNSQILPQATLISSVAEQYRNLSSCPCADDAGGGGDGGGGSCAWTAEQIRELLGYVDHIDQDQHKRFDQINVMSNRVANIDERMDSYAKLVSGVLYQDGTIQLDDGESWTNVYFSGESENYYYDKSNILQRIELILFGLAHSTTNFTLDASSVTNKLDDVAANNVTNQFREFSSDSTNSFLNAKEKFDAKLNSIKSISSMFVFWGTAGSDSPFTLGYVPNLDGSGGGQYIEVGNGFLSSEVSRFRQLCRYGFQLIWATSFLFLIWLFYVRLFKYVVIFLKYAFEWINEAFAS